MALDFIEEVRRKSPSPDPEPRTHRRSRMSKICGDSVVDFQRWKCLEHILFFLLLILGMYAVGALAANAVNLQAWEHVKDAEAAKLSPFEIHAMIAAQAILLEGVIFGFLFLFILRNCFGFLVTLILLCVSALILIGIIIYLLKIVLNDDDLLTAIYEQFKLHLTKMHSKFNFDDYQQINECCGIRGYRDWEGWRKLFKRKSVPMSCCRKDLDPLERPNCGVDALDKNKDVVEKTINTNGCGKKLADEYRYTYLQLLIQGIIVLILIILTIIVLCILFYRWYKFAHLPPPPPDPREQEDDIESDIIPGTPMKSYVSSTQKLYYAP